MARTPANLDWVVCHATTRLVLRRGVACPTRGRVPGLECLGCRYLMTSSLERSEVMWCEARGPVAILRGALQGRAPKLEPDRLAAALARPRESSSLHGADLAARAEESAAPALGAERGVERRDGRPVIPADVADARSHGVHVVSMGRTARRARVPFALPEPADRSAPVGPSVTRR